MTMGDNPPPRSENGHFWTARDTEGATVEAVRESLDADVPQEARTPGTGGTRSGEQSGIGADGSPTGAVFDPETATEEEKKCNQACVVSHVKGYFPSLPLIKQYNRKWLKSDLISGITVGCMLVPQGMAYALLAGMPPINGLYAGFLPLLTYALFTSSRQQQVGPVAIHSLLTASTAASMLHKYKDLPDEEYDAMYIKLVLLLAFVSGIIEVGFAVCRLGMLVNFLSHSVLSGFTSAASIVIGSSQLKYLFGLKLPRRYYAWDTIYEVCKYLPKTKGNVVPVAVVCLGTLYFFKWWKKNKFDAKTAGTGARIFKLVCDLGVLVVTILASVWCYCFELLGHKLPRVGKVPGGFPPFDLPDFSVSDDAGELIVSSIIIGLVGYIELIAIAQAYAAVNGYQIDANQEFLGIGLANVVGSFFGAQPVAGSFSRTAVNAAAGAKTPLAVVITAIIIMLAITCLTSAFYYIPEVALGSIVIIAVIDLFKWDDFVEAWKASKPDFCSMMLTFVITLWKGTTWGIGTGAGLALIIYLYQTAYPHIAILGLVKNTIFFKDYKKAQDPSKLEQFDGISVLRLDADVWFANCGYVREQVLDTVKRNCSSFLIIELSSCNRIDLSGLRMFATLIRELKMNKVTIMLSEPKEKLLKQLRRADNTEIEKVLSDALYPLTALALAAAQKLQDQAHEPFIQREETGPQLIEADGTVTLEHAGLSGTLGGRPRVQWRDTVPSVEKDPRDIPQDFAFVRATRSAPPGKSTTWVR